MHTMDANTSNVPAFITKLWKLVEDPTYDDLICWNQNGRSFIIHDQSKFAKELLPLYFKHSNMASFIRQLNMYGFRKVSNIENSGLRSERDDIEFYNQYFVKGQEYALEFIKRKISTGKSGLTGIFKQEDVSEMLSDMETIRGKQESVDTLLSNMQRENEALWREVAILRQKHHKQQQIVEKLIQFLVSLVQNRGLIGIKRKAQLMIDNIAENSLPRNKVLKPNECDFTSGDSRGPIIHDVTDDLEDDGVEASANSPIITTALNLGEMSPNPPQVMMTEVNSSATNDNLLTDSSKPDDSLNILDPLQESIKELGLVPEDPLDVSNVNEPNVDDNSLSVDSLLRTSLNTPPGSPSLLKTDIFANESASKVDDKKNDVKDLVISTQNNDQTMATIIPNVLTEHIDGIEAELDWLQDQLTSGGLNIDSSTLMGLFSMDEAGLSIPNNNFPNKLNNNDIIGNEVVQFNPNNTNLLFDDLDLDNISQTDDTQDGLLMKEGMLPNLDTPQNSQSVSFASGTNKNGKSIKPRKLV